MDCDFKPNKKYLNDFNSEITNMFFIEIVIVFK